MLAPFVKLWAGAGAGTGEAEDGADGRGAALAGLAESTLFTGGVVIGGLVVGVPFVRAWL